MCIEVEAYLGQVDKRSYPYVVMETSMYPWKPLVVSDLWCVTKGTYKNKIKFKTISSITDKYHPFPFWFIPNWGTCKQYRDQKHTSRGEISSIIINFLLPHLFLSFFGKWMRILAILTWVNINNFLTSCSLDSYVMPVQCLHKSDNKSNISRWNFETPVSCLDQKLNFL